jgi:hypothetical protein
MRYGLKLVTPPLVEPLDLTATKNYLRIDSGDTTQDSIILDMITAARQRCERIIDRALVSQAWRMTMDTWPSDSPIRWPRFLVDDWPFGSSGGFDGTTNGVIRLPRSPLISVDSITYIDIGGNTQTWNSSNYNVDTDAEPGRITLVYNQVFPVILPRADAITVSFTAGYGTTADTVPLEIRDRLRSCVAYMFENREQPDQKFLDDLFAGLWIGEYH